MTTDSLLTPQSTLSCSPAPSITPSNLHVPRSLCQSRDESERLNTYLQSLAQKLNSNQEFSPDDSFTMETTFIHTPGPGSGNGNKQKPGRETLGKLLARKKSVITIKKQGCVALCPGHRDHESPVRPRKSLPVLPQSEIGSSHPNDPGQKTPSSRWST